MHSIIGTLVKVVKQFTNTRAFYGGALVDHTSWQHE